MKAGSADPGQRCTRRGFCLSFLPTHTRSGQCYQFSSHFASWVCRDDFPGAHCHQSTKGVWLMLPVIRKHVTPAPESKWWRRGEGGGQFWRAPFAPYNTMLSCAMDPCVGVRREQDRANMFCNMRVQLGWLATVLCVVGVCLWYIFFPL